MQVLHCIWAVSRSLRRRSRRRAPSPPGTTGYTVFVRGAPVGREDVAIRTDATGTTIISQGRTSGPPNVVLQRVEFRYQPDGLPGIVFLEGSSQRRRHKAANHVQGRLGGHGRFATGNAGVFHADGIPADGHASNCHRRRALRCLDRGSGEAAVGDEFRVFPVPSVEVGARLVRGQGRAHAEGTRHSPCAGTSSSSPKRVATPSSTSPRRLRRRLVPGQHSVSVARHRAKGCRGCDVANRGLLEPRR